MTAKEYLESKKIENRVLWVMNTGGVEKKYYLSDLLVDFSRHVAKQAVRESQKGVSDHYQDIVDVISAKILNRINKLTE